jgi:ABC-2 type transport system permease protein
MIGALRYEWVRLTTLRSTWWLTGASIFVAGGVSYLWSLALNNNDAMRGLGRPAAFAAVLTQGASTSAIPLLVAYIMGLFGVFTFGHEYRHGMIRATLTALPQRSNVLAAKIIVTAAWAGLVAVICLALGALWGFVSGSEVNFSVTVTGVPRVMLGYVIYVIMFTLIGLGVAAIVRNQTGAIVIMLVVPLVLETVLRLVIVVPDMFNSIQGIVQFFPFDAGGQMYVLFPVDFNAPIGPLPLDPLPGGVVMSVFMLLVLAVGGTLFVIRDA